MNGSLAEHLEGFLVHLSARRSAATVRSYGSDLRQYLAFVADDSVFDTSSLRLLQWRLLKIEKKVEERILEKILKKEMMKIG